MRNPGEFQRAGRLSLILALLAIAASCASLIYVARTAPARFGTYHDDGIYVATAKALAEGQGYRIVSLPDQPLQTKYPPTYPVFLSLIWRVFPNFPQNLWAMIAFSILTTLSLLWMTWRYLLKCGYATLLQAVVVVAMTGLNWRMLILGTACYSEMLYAALSVGGLHLAEWHEDSRRNWWTAIGLGSILGLVALTRTTGIALLMAFVVIAVLRKQWRRALLPSTVAGLFVLGWIVWSYLNRTSAHVVNVDYYTNYFGYFSLVLRDLQQQLSTSRIGLFSSILQQNFVGGMLISIPIVILGSMYDTFGGLTGVVVCPVFVLVGIGYWKSARKRLRLLHVYVAFSLIIFLLWLPGVSYDRFLMPLLPFLLLFLTYECNRLGLSAWTDISSADRSAKVKGTLLAIFLVGIGSVALYGYGAGFHAVITAERAVVASGAQDSLAIDWIKGQTEPSDILVCYRDPKYFLYTGRRAVRNFEMPMGSWDGEAGAMSQLTRMLSRIVTESRARYLVVTASDFELEPRPEPHRKALQRMIDQNPQSFVRVFAAPDGGSSIYRIENPIPASGN